MFEKLSKTHKKIRNKMGNPVVWGTVAVFSPTLVACYGVPDDLHDFDDRPYDTSNYAKFVDAVCETGEVWVNVQETEPDQSTIHDPRQLNSHIACKDTDDKKEMLCKACSENPFGFKSENITCEAKDCPEAK